MSTRYKIHNQQGIYFITCATVGWFDVFSRQIYRDILIDSLKFCQEKKGLELYVYVIMTNHIHLIAAGNETNHLSHILRDFKKFTSGKIKLIIPDESESRRKWIMSIFMLAGTTNTSNKEFQLWRHDNHPIELFSNEVTKQKLDYVHLNPVRAGFVTKPEDWIYSSASNYADISGLLDVRLLFLGFICVFSWVW